jgi:hypothetical protein
LLTRLILFDPDLLKANHSIQLGACKIVFHNPNNVTMWDKLLLLPNQKKSFCSTGSALMEGIVCWALSEAQTEF